MVQGFPQCNVMHVQVAHRDWFCFRVVQASRAHCVGFLSQQGQSEKLHCPFACLAAPRLL